MKDLDGILLFFSAEKCDEPLVSGLHHSAFSSSSSKSGSYYPGYAKTNKRGGKRSVDPFVVENRNSFSAFIVTEESLAGTLNHSCHIYTIHRKYELHLQPQLRIKQKKILVGHMGWLVKVEEILEFEIQNDITIMSKGIFFFNEKISQNVATKNLPDAITRCRQLCIHCIALHLLLYTLFRRFRITWSLCIFSFCPVPRI